MTTAALNWALAHPDCGWAWLQLSQRERWLFHKLIGDINHPVVGLPGDTFSRFRQLHHEGYRFHE